MVHLLRECGSLLSTNCYACGSTELIYAIYHVAIGVRRRLSEQNHGLRGRRAQVVLERTRPKTRGWGPRVTNAARQAGAARSRKFCATVRRGCGDGCKDRCGDFDRCEVMFLVSHRDRGARPLLGPGDHLAALHVWVAVLRRGFCAEPGA